MQEDDRPQRYAAETAAGLLDRACKKSLWTTLLSKENSKMGASSRSLDYDGRGAICCCVHAESGPLEDAQGDGVNITLSCPQTPQYMSVIRILSRVTFSLYIFRAFAA